MSNPAFWTWSVVPSPASRVPLAFQCQEPPTYCCQCWGYRFSNTHTHTHTPTHPTPPHDTHLGSHSMYKPAMPRHWARVKMAWSRKAACSSSSDSIPSCAPGWSATSSCCGERMGLGFNGGSACDRASLQRNTCTCAWTARRRPALTMDMRMYIILYYFIIHIISYNLLIFTALLCNMYGCVWNCVKLENIVHADVKVCHDVYTIYALFVILLCSGHAWLQYTNTS